MISEMTILKANIMGGMNEYIKEIGNDDLWDLWIAHFPDECSEEELMEMAKDDEIFRDIVTWFGYLLKLIDRQIIK